MRPHTDAPVRPAQARIKVGDWTLEPDLNQLATAGRAIKIEPKATAVLLYLASRPGQVVSRESLLSEAWPDVVVSDDSVTQVIIKLRKALEDDPDRPTYIQTITKKGYRLVAPVSQVSEGGGSPASRRPDRFYWISGVLVLALMLATGTWWARSYLGAPSSPGVRPGPLLTQSPTVAVLPFEVLSKDSQDFALARGITADLLHDLSKSPGLSVIGFRPLEGQTGGEASTNLEAEYVVSGTVQRIADRLRLQVYLNEQRTGNQVWSERFDRPIKDFFAIQEELAPQIARVLPAKVSEAELRRMAQRHTRNLEAYQYFQHGQAALLLREEPANQSARELFRRAIELDATFARAYSGLALTYAADYRNGWTSDGAGALDHALKFARTALEINPDVPETYWALAYVHGQRREHEQALGYLDKAISMYPSFADGYALMASIKTLAGQPGTAIPLMRTAMRLNPRSGYLYFVVLGRAYFFVGDLEQAGINLDEASKRNPAYLETHVYMAALDILKGDKLSAAREVDEIRTLDPAFSANRWLESYPMTDNGQRTKLMHALDQLGL